ncbi:MAG TPA: hypothetical protein VFY29_14115 [Terriglobia bacterium]|nr:hypothetical protein [Terriglobia bacterium]
MSMKTKRIKEIVALTMIGDGLLSAVDPKRHVGLWRVGPRPLLRLTDRLLRKPGLTRILGVAAVAGGVWWASRQKPHRGTRFLWRSA